VSGFGDGDPLYYQALEWVEDMILRLAGWGRREEYAPGEPVRIRDSDRNGYRDRRGAYLGVIRYPADIYRGPVYVTDVYDPRNGAWRRPGPWSARDMRPLDDPTDAELLILLEREVTR
jgi:hypothetical protein